MSQSAFKWTCRFCGTKQIGNSDNSSRNIYTIYNSTSKHGRLCYEAATIACLEEACGELTFSIDLRKNDAHVYAPEPVLGARLHHFNLLPRGRAARVPKCIPGPIATDFSEACEIVSLSPKAAATLARRALQGMIRDFAGISKDKLIDEIRTLRTMVEEGTAPRDISLESVQAIDHVRDIGNFGAHMEKDIGLIIDIDPDEAEILLQLLEQLFDDWYVAREARKARFAAVSQISAEKKLKKTRKAENLILLLLRAAVLARPRPSTSSG